jgi:hypothetical protein
MNRATINLLGLILFFTLPGCSKQNPGPPILLLATSSNFGTYTGEILKAEGFNEFDIDSLKGGSISTAFLAKYDLIIIAEDVTDPHDWQLLSRFVRKGGNLIAVRPVELPEDLFGISVIPGSLNGGYISIDTSWLEGKALSGRKLQLHTIARLCEVKGARTIALLTDRSVNEKKYPGVVTKNLGKGKITEFLYNLPENIVFTRQGNPQLAGIEKDSIPGLRAMDLFTDGWVDTSNNIINQADEQMRLLSRCIEMMNSDTKPLPRLWYFPDTLKCLVTLTNDGEFRGETDFETQFREVDSMGAKMSLYVMETGKVTKQWSDRWTARGFEISGHPDDTKEAATPVWNNMENVLADKIKTVSELYGLTMTTVVNHWFVWCGTDPAGRQEFAAQAEIEASHNLSMEANYAHYDNKSGQGHFLGSMGLNQGNFTGSGLPMKFATSRGKIVDIYQHLNNVYDQEYTENHDPDGFFDCFKGLVDRSIYDQVYSYISVKSHNDEYYFSRVPLLKMLAYANSKHIPVWTVAQLSDFIRMKDEATFSDIEWTGNELKFNLVSSVGNKNGLTYMIPFRYNEMNISEIRVNGKAVPLIVENMRGKEYAFNTVKPGSNYSIIAKYVK